MNSKCFHEYVHKTDNLLLILYLPQNYDVFQQCEEDKDDTGAHPNIQGRNVTYPWGTLSEINKNILLMKKISIKMSFFEVQQQA